jgi:hypothetical protein
MQVAIGGTKNKGPDMTNHICERCFREIEAKVLTLCVGRQEF